MNCNPIRTRLTFKRGVSTQVYNNFFVSVRVTDCFELMEITEDTGTLKFLQPGTFYTEERTLSWLSDNGFNLVSTRASSEAR